jgi:hypothetical protein
VRDVEHHRVPELAQHRKGPDVHNEIVVAEADAALGDENRFVAFGRDLGDHVTHVARRQELSLLDVDGLVRPGRGDEEIGLARQERRDLNDVRDFGDAIRLCGLMNVGEDRQARARLHVGQRAES